MEILKNSSKYICLLSETKISLELKKYKDVSGTYIIENIINGKIYIGSSINLYLRFNDHRRSYKKIKNKFYNAVNKYGEVNFKCYLIDLCLKEDVLKYEQKLFNFFNEKEFLLLTYNTCTIAGNSLNRILSEETKQKISKAKKGVPNLLLKGVPKTQEHKDNIKNKFKKGSKAWNKDKNMSQDTKDKLSDSLKGNIPWNKGKKLTQEQTKNYYKPFLGKIAHNAEKIYVFNSNNKELIEILDSVSLAIKKYNIEKLSYKTPKYINNIILVRERHLHKI